MKLKKGSLSDTLAFMLIISLFFALINTFLFNSMTQERRSLLVDELNKQAMTLQAKLEGYSNTYTFSYMYNGGVRLNESQVQAAKNKAIKEAKEEITKYFANNRNNNILYLESADDIKIEITDGPSVKDVATVNISVKYYAMFRSPYAKNDGATGTAAAKMKLKMKDTASRVIENPIRQKNI